MANASTLALQDVRYRWPGRGGFSLSIPAFSLARGETVLLLGESGSGKSTLLSLICGTVAANTGAVLVEGNDISALSGRRRDRLRAERIGVIFQQFNLLPFGTVADNIMLPLRFAPDRRARAGDAYNTAKALCDTLGLPEGVMTAKAATLSVGQQQRVAVARALIGQPPMIVADEPTSSLDAGSQAAFLDLMFAQVGAAGSSLLMVSHDPRLADRFDRTVRIEDIATARRQAA